MNVTRTNNQPNFRANAHFADAATKVAFAKEGEAKTINFITEELFPKLKTLGDNTISHDLQYAGKNDEGQDSFHLHSRNGFGLFRQDLKTEAPLPAQRIAAKAEQFLKALNVATKGELPAKDALSIVDDEKSLAVVSKLSKAEGAYEPPKPRRGGLLGLLIGRATTTD